MPKPRCCLRVQASIGWPAPPDLTPPLPRRWAAWLRGFQSQGFSNRVRRLRVVEHTQTVMLDFTPWLIPGDDLKRLHFTAALAVPINGRTGTEGALLLAGMRNRPGSIPGPFRNQLHADDLLPVEVLTARLQAARSQTMMLEKLIDSEKFAGVGQLAANVAEQLNNPLTVVLGYASLLDEGTSLATA